MEIIYKTELRYKNGGQSKNKYCEYAYYNGIRFIKNLNYYVHNEIRLHRYIYEIENKCSILKGNEIHHIDFDKNNNDISNLKLLTKKEHLSLHKKIQAKTQKISQKGYKGSFLGKKHSEETKLKISNSIKLNNFKKESNND